MDKSSYSQLSEAEQAAFHRVREQWRDWALANVGASGDYWDGLSAVAETDGWRIQYQASLAPFVLPSQAVATSLIEYAQAGLSKL